jgi:tetratricopeptide (TPR) repeat protein
MTDRPVAVMAARRPGESDVSWRLRSRDLHVRYESATTAIQQGHYADALIWLSAIVEEDASYRNVPELLEKVYQARRSRADVANREGIDLERRGRLAEAADAYDRALAIDPDFPDAIKRLAAVQAVIAGQVADTLRRAAVLEAFGLTGDVAAAYQEVLALLPRTSGDRRFVEQRLSALSPTRSEPLLQNSAIFSMRLDPMESTETLEFVDDPGGRFIARLPTRRWQLTPGSGATIAIVTERDGRGSLLVEAIALSDGVSLATSYDLAVKIESRLLTRRDPTATAVVNRTLDPPLPMVILDYRRPGPGGTVRRVRQFSIVRGHTLYRISAMNGLAPFYEVEGVFNDFALSFQPTDRATVTRP